MNVHNKVILHWRVELSINFFLASLNVLYSHPETFIFLNFFLATGCEIKNPEKVVGERLCLYEVFNIDSHLLDLVFYLHVSLIVQLKIPVKVGINFFLALLVIQTDQVLANLLCVFNLCLYRCETIEQLLSVI